MDGDLDVRLPGGETGREIADRFDDVLREIADAHPGETVLVVSHGGAIGLGVPAIARMDAAPAAARQLRHRRGARRRRRLGLHAVRRRSGPTDVGSTHGCPARCRVVDWCAIPPRDPELQRPADPEEDPGVGDRRRPADARAVRPAPGDLRRLHGQRPRPRLHRGLRPRRGAPPLRQHPHREQRHRAADHPAARGRPRPDPPLGQRRRRHRGDLLRQRHHGRDRQAGGHPRHPAAGRPRPPAPALGPDPARAAAGGLHRPLRAPQQRAALARVDRRRGDHPRGRRRPHRRRPARAPSSSSTPTARSRSARSARPAT